MILTLPSHAFPDFRQGLDPQNFLLSHEGKHWGKDVNNDYHLH
jgi:hypothetical protein